MVFRGSFTPLAFLGEPILLFVPLEFRFIFWRRHFYVSINAICTFPRAFLWLLDDASDIIPVLLYRQRIIIAAHLCLNWVTSCAELAHIYFWEWRDLRGKVWGSGCCNRCVMQWVCHIDMSRLAPHDCSRVLDLIDQLLSEFVINFRLMCRLYLLWVLFCYELLDFTICMLFFHFFLQPLVLLGDHVRKVCLKFT